MSHQLETVFLCCKCGVMAPNACVDDIWRAADEGGDVIGAGDTILYRCPLHQFGPTDTVYTVEVNPLLCLDLPWRQ